MDLHSKPPFGQSLGSHRVKGAALLRVREVLGLKNFEFPVLLDKEEVEDSIVVDCSTISHSPHNCQLHRSDTLGLSETV